MAEPESAIFEWHAVAWNGNYRLISIVIGISPVAIRCTHARSMAMSLAGRLAGRDLGGMPKKARELSALEVRRLEHPGQGGNTTFAVGGVDGLLLQITPAGARSWILRTMIGGRRRSIGLGSFPAVGLGDARQRARDAITGIRSGIDPVEERKSARAAVAAAQRRGVSFRDAVDRFLGAKLQEFRNPKHRQQWKNTLDTYAMPVLGEMLVDDITVQDVLRAIEPIWARKTETAARLRGRIEAVLTWATVAGYRGGTNPAAWAGNLRELLPAPGKIKGAEHQPAVALSDAHRWFSALRKREGMGSRALEFLTLCASRSSEVRGATWQEIEIEAGVWIVPAARMKMKREHRVVLSEAALELLRGLPHFEGSDLVFPAPRGGQLSDMTLSAAMKRLHESDIEAGGPGFLDRASKRPAVPHGLRSTFRDWVAERTNYPREWAEIALAHKNDNAVEAAYQRSDLIERRRSMMAAWAGFLAGDNK